MISVIIVQFNKYRLTERAICSFQKFYKGDYEIIVVDNASTDGSREVLRRLFPAIEIISSEKNRGFGNANNTGVQKTSGEYLLFLNNDTETTMDFVSPMIEYLNTHTSVGIMGPRLLNDDTTFQLSYGRFPAFFNEYYNRRRQRWTAENIDISEKNSQKVQQIDWVSGAALLTRRSLFQKLGGFDHHYFMYYEDSDLCFRAQKLGYSTSWFPSVSLIHHRGKSCMSMSAMVLAEYRKGQLYYYRQHRPLREQWMLKLFLLIKYSILSLDKKKRILSCMVLKAALSR